MSRGVSRPVNAEYVYYADVSHLKDEFDWEIFIENILEKFLTKYPSLYKSDCWLNRESRALLENDFAYIGISEYCGCASLWIVVKEQYPNLAYNWADNAADTLKEFADLVKVGTFSNGESVYERLN